MSVPAAESPSTKLVAEARKSLTTEEAGLTFFMAPPKGIMLTQGKMEPVTPNKAERLPTPEEGKKGKLLSPSTRMPAVEGITPGAGKPEASGQKDNAEMAGFRTTMEVPVQKSELP